MLINTLYDANIRYPFIINCNNPIHKISIVFAQGCTTKASVPSCTKRKKKVKCPKVNLNCCKLVSLGFKLPKSFDPTQTDPLISNSKDSEANFRIVSQFN